MKITKRKIKDLIKNSFIKEMRIYSKPRAFRITGDKVVDEAELESQKILSSFSSNGKYTIIHGPFLVSLTDAYFGIIFEYDGFSYGCYSTSGFSSDGSEGFTSVGWVLTGGFLGTDRVTRVMKMPNHKVGLPDGSNVEVNGKYPVVYPIYEDVLMDLSIKLNKDFCKNITFGNNKTNYVKQVTGIDDRSSAISEFHKKRINLFNTLLFQEDAYRNENSLNDWKEAILTSLKPKIIY